MKKLIAIIIVLFLVFWGGLTFIAIKKKPRTCKGYIKDYKDIIVSKQTLQRDFLLDHIPEKSCNISYFIIGLFTLEAKFNISEADFIAWLKRKKFFLGEPPFENNLVYLPGSICRLENDDLRIKRGTYLKLLRFCLRDSDLEVWPCVTYEIMYDTATSTCYYNFFSRVGEPMNWSIIKVNKEVGFCDKDGTFIIKPDKASSKQIDEYLKDTFGNYQFMY